MLRFCDSFKHYSTAQLTRKWTAAQANTTVVAAVGRFGGQALALKSTTSGVTSFGVSKTLDAQATWIVGYAFLTDLGGYLYLATFVDIGATQVFVVLEPGGTIAAYRGSATAGAISNLLGRSTLILKSGVWYYIEIKVTINDTTGIVTVKINGATALSLTGQDTKQSANATANIIHIGQNGLGGASAANSTSLIYAEDLYICDATGSSNNDFLGECKVECLFPDGNGANTSWTPSTGVNHAALVDENPATDDTDYVSSSTAGHKDTFTFGNMATASGTVKGIQITATARKDDVGTRTIAPIIRQSATDYIGTNQNLSTTYTMYLQTYDVNPATAAAFTISEVNADEFGLQLVA